MTSHQSMVQARDNAYKYASRHRAAAMLGSSGRELGIVSANKARMLR